MAAEPRPGALERFVPAVALLRGYQRSWLGGDVLAGASAGAVVIPQAMAYGTVAGLPVQVGLYTSIVPMAAYALLGGARRMSVSTLGFVVESVSEAVLTGLKVGVGLTIAAAN